MLQSCIKLKIEIFHTDLNNRVRIKKTIGDKENYAFSWERLSIKIRVV